MDEKHSLQPLQPARFANRFAEKSPLRDGSSRSAGLGYGHQLWSLDDVGGNTVASPVPFGDGCFLVGASAGRNGENAEGARRSNMAVAVFGKSGETTVLAAGPEKQVLAVHQLWKSAGNEDGEDRRSAGDSRAPLDSGS